MRVLNLNLCTVSYGVGLKFCTDFSTNTWFCHPVCPAKSSCGGVHTLLAQQQLKTLLASSLVSWYHWLKRSVQDVNILGPFLFVQIELVNLSESCYRHNLILIANIWMSWRLARETSQELLLINTWQLVQTNKMTQNTTLNTKNTMCSEDIEITIEALHMHTITWQTQDTTILIGIRLNNDVNSSCMHGPGER